MRPVLAGVWILVAVTTSPAAASAQARDPHLVWRTLRTDHFEVSYHEPLGVVARRVAAVGERAHAILAPLLDRDPEERTRVVLSDESDGANGSASALPFNTMRLFATGPEDLTPLHDYDDWLSVLVTHEHTHVLHLDTIGGIPALINSIFGKVYPPNSVQPRWFLEGFAVHEESAHTAGGRLRSSMWDMWLRMDVLEDRLLRLDQISNTVDRWPHGNVWYLYGSYFVDYIAQEHGHEALVRMSHDYGSQAIPYGLNRVARRATGRTFTELYDDFCRDLREHYGSVAEGVRAEGLMGGTPITSHGESARAPRFLSDEHLVYWAGDGQEHGQLRIIDADDGGGARELVQVAGSAQPAVHPDGRHVYYSAVDTHRDIHYFHDLFRIDRETGERTRLTTGMRAREPDVSPDGRRIAFSVNGAATTHLVVADIADIENTRRVVVRSRRYEQVYTPRWSPDGQSIAFSHWRSDGYRDIRVLDVVTGRVRDLMRDRALDTGPVWSPDGQTLYFSSDRTGIANIYAFDLETDHTSQVTNVLAGAYQPAISPNGRHMVYLGYSSLGFDLHRMTLDPERFRRASPYDDDRPEPSPLDEVAVVQSEAYDPLPTLLPRSYLLELGSDGFGRQLAITFEGSDVVGYHAYGGRVGIGLDRGNINADLNYVYQRTPWPVRFRLFRTVAPRGGLFVAGRQERWAEEAYGAEVGVSYGLPRALHFENLSISYSLTHIGKWEPFGGRLDPNDPPPRLPETGLLSTVRAGWSWSDVVRTSYDISPSEGRILQLNVGVSDPLLGSQFQSVSASWGITQFFENPLIEHHVLATRYAGGLSGGDLGRRGVFSVGGFPETTLLDAFLDDIILGGAALRGYAPFDRAGTQYHLVQVEYRLPLMRPMASLGLFPAYLNRVWASVFMDYGDAFFGKLDLGSFRVGIGAELHTQFTVGFFLPYSLRIGVARGLSEGGLTQGYAHIGLPF